MIKVPVEIEVVKNESLRMFAQGLEDIYLGKRVRYNDRSKTFVFYYFSKHKRVYIIDGVEKTTSLPQIVEKVRIICTIEDSKVSIFKRFVKTVQRQESINILYTLSDLFFRELYALLQKKKPQLSELIQLFYYYASMKTTSD